MIDSDHKKEAGASLAMLPPLSERALPDNFVAIVCLLEAQLLAI